MTHLQISDALQEFLCLPDQLKLVRYDNKKINELSQALIQDGSDNIFEQKDRDVFDDEADKIPATNMVMLNTRLLNLVKFIKEQQKGCIRFNLGRDWNLKDFRTKELASELDSSYSQMLTFKEDLFS